HRGLRPASVRDRGEDALIQPVQRAALLEDEGAGQDELLGPVRRLRLLAQRRALQVAQVAVDAVAEYAHRHHEDDGEDAADQHESYGKYWWTSGRISSQLGTRASAPLMVWLDV